MMNNWINCTLSDVGDIIGGATPSTKKEEFYGGTISWITPKDLSSFTGRYIDKGERNITEIGLNSCSAQLMPKGTVLFTSRAPIGYVAIAKKEVCTNQGFKSVVAKDNIDPLFLYYLLVYNKDNIEALGSGTTFKEVSGKTMKTVPVIIPSNLEEQKQIAKILSSIDDKIELNNKINDNLEQQAQAIFKSWFVDFEPFGGVMPSDWVVGTVSSLGNVVGGSTPSKAKEEYYTNKGISWITPKDLSINKSKFVRKGLVDITDLGLKNSSATIMPKGTVLFSSRAPIGYIAIANNDVTTNQGFKSVAPYPNIGTAYTYYFLKNNIDIIEGMASGSTFKEVSGSIMKTVPAIIPNNDILCGFNEFCNPIFSQQEKLEHESKTLSQLRDTLLPKLMSGEIDVSQVEI